MDEHEVRETQVEDGIIVDSREGHLDPDGKLSLTGAAAPLCARCGGDHIAAHCPTLIAGSSGIDPDAEGTR